MKEFSQKGFKNASTDTIVREAAISKGALFHYFKNKKDLFMYLYDYSLDILKDEILTKINFDEKDIFNRRRQALELKIEVLRMHPELYEFLGTAYLEDSTEVKGDLDSRNKGLMATAHAKLYEGIDFSKFKEDVDIKRAIEIISWTIEGFVNKETAKIKNIPLHEINYDEMLKEIDKYLEMLKKSFYK
jgi:TetR/AcrR family transcriptional regulator